MKIKDTSSSFAWMLLCCMIMQTFLPNYLAAKTLVKYHPVNTQDVQMNFGEFQIINDIHEPKSEVKDEVEKTTLMPGGPDQPEVQSFTPIGTSDMVNPFTGDFSYNIPLMDVDGYPINIAYNAGITMDQEATWVGLGWNLNPGVVNRAMRGLPDDFNGVDKISKTFNMKKDWTVGVNTGLGVELFGFNLPGGGSGNAGLNASLGIEYNSYNGFGTSVAISPSISIANKNKTELNFGLGLSGSSQGGATVSPSFSIQKESSNTGLFTKTTTTKSMNIGSTINSRSGLGEVSFGISKRTTRNRTALGHMFNTGTESSNGFSIPSSFNFGVSSYTPQISMPMNSFGMTFSFKTGVDVFGSDATWDAKGYFTSQWLREYERSQPAYGYLNLQKGQNNSEALLDFNRENDGPFTKFTPALPNTALTYDIFSVSGQGVGGSYRAYRPDIGYVFDPEMSNNSVNASIGLEVAPGSTFKGGIDLTLSYSNSRTSVWDNLNQAELKFTSSIIPFREANEMSINTDMDLLNDLGGSFAVYLDNPTFLNLKNTLKKTNGTELSEVDEYKKIHAEKRNQVIYTLTHAEVKKGFGIENLHPYAYTKSDGTIDHHIAQFTTLNTDGTRYVYGIAAYNISQKDVSFAIGANGSHSARPEECLTGLVDYTPDIDNSVNNDYGIDHHFHATTTPAYAHSYLLTTVLNPDYVDADGTKGPSPGDLGGFIKFSYKKIESYKWKNPVQLNKATFDEGMSSDKTDDKAHYNYGEKELWYVTTIKTKNHVAVFHTSKRKDAVSVFNENGGLNSDIAMQKLDSIQLFSLPEYEANQTSAIPLKVVHFEYDYSLCSNYSQNIEGGGKLTLRKIYFTYQWSNKGKYSPYIFNYGYNPNYDMKSIDRWGNYKPRPSSCSGNIAQFPLRPSDYPYVGFDKDQVDQNVAAWALDSIQLPSGGSIGIDYESDEYAYVQHKQATQMFKITGVEFDNNSNDIETTGTVALNNTSDGNAKLYFELIPGFDNPDDISLYTQGLQNVYFRALMKFEESGSTDKYDFVPGYGELDVNYTPQIVTVGSTKMGCIKLKAVTLKDNGGTSVNPIVLAAIQFGRLYLSRQLPPSGQDLSDGTDLGDLGNSVLGAFASYGELFTGPNEALFDKKNGTDLVVGKSWLRLNNPNQHKLGGGHRVKQIRMNDAWDEMTQGSMEKYSYGQNYTYNLEDGSSSGVASYEPQLGGDENVWRQPVANDKKILLAPDIRNYQETPFGEQFFPSPSVGYSRVTVQDIPRTGVTRTATGRVVHEFYTAKDFPTIVSRTNPNIHRFKAPVFAYFFQLSIDEMSASQGFVIQTNDMHGKPKSQKVYAENKTEPISKVEYFYKSSPIVIDNISANQLENVVTTIEKNGVVSSNTIGLVFDAVGDYRKSTSNSVSASFGANINTVVPPLIVPSLIPSGSYERTDFRSASFTKVIERFGILENTIATDLGSIVETKTLAYDAETGSAMLTETTTDFNDKVYSFTYPAHWYYDAMGQAYKNIDLKFSFASNPLVITNGTTNQLTSSDGFFRGDELAVTTDLNEVKLVWVVEANPSGIKLMNKAGDLVNYTILSIKLLRSGRRNMQNSPIGSVVLRSNPLYGLQSNVFENVLQAGAVEFTDEWNTFCECFLNEENEVNSKNPFVLGLKGTFRPKASYVHLAGRTQSFENTNSNIRNDGVFTSFMPFYRMTDGQWVMNKENWTYTSSVVEFSPFGQALETVDALDRYSSSMFGYNQTLPIAVAANTRYRQLGFDGFEDRDYINCSDNHFKVGENDQIVSNISHTGRRSIRVTESTPVEFTTSLQNECGEACFHDLTFVHDRDLYYYWNITELENNGSSITYTVLIGNPEIGIWEDPETGEQWLYISACPNTEPDTCTQDVEVRITEPNGCVGVGHAY